MLPLGLTGYILAAMGLNCSISNELQIFSPNLKKLGFKDIRGRFGDHQTQKNRA